MALKIGDKVSYPGPKGKRVTGRIHGIRVAEAEGREFVLSYLVDTGKVHPRFKGIDDDQHVQVDVLPADIKPA